MPTDERAADPGALIESARLHHTAPADLRYARACVVCYEAMPCTTIRLADALEAATTEHGDYAEHTAASHRVMGAMVDELETEIAAARAEAAALLPVVEAAQRYVDLQGTGTVGEGGALILLREALAARGAPE